MSAQLNSIYISPGLAEKLGRIPDYPVTSVVAPMGYGKTKAVDWWRAGQAGRRDARVFYQAATADSLDELWKGLCRNLRGDGELTEELSALGFPQESGARALLLGLVEDAMKRSPRQVFYVLDDLHFVSSEKLTALIAFFCGRMPRGLHLVLLSRNAIFDSAALVHLGSDLWQITADDLRLSEAGIKAYAKRSGIRLDQEQTEELWRSTEGWFSMVYLHLRAYAQSGTLLANDAGIYSLIYEVLFAPLSERTRDFLTLLGVPDEFTAEEATFLWPEGDSDELLDSLTSQNAFVTCGGGVYRYHNMLRDCAREKFAQLPEDIRSAHLRRMGQWAERTGDHYRAELYFERSGAWPELLEAVFADRALSITGENFQNLLRWCQSCPEDVLKAHPDTLLVLMRKLFSFSRIPELLRMKTLLEEALAQSADMSETEKNNYRGECQLVMSFTAYNDIAAMSVYHRAACTLMTRDAVTIDPHGYWAFGAPSVLMLYHREAGALDAENAAMRECMPFYYQLTGYHGNGAEYAMQCETDFLRGDLREARFNLQFALAAARRRGQYSILVPAQITNMQMLLYAGDFAGAEALLGELRELLRAQRQYLLLYTVALAEAWLYALVGRRAKLPPWLADENHVSPMLRPAAPMQEIVRSQVMLAAAQYDAVAARESAVSQLCGDFHALLCTIYMNIQLSAAYERLGKRQSADAYLRAALDAAMPDGLLLPFVLEGDYIAPQLRELSSGEEHRDSIRKILEMYESYRAMGGKTGCLTEREREIAALAAERMTNREIARELNLSESTVKYYLNLIYGKLGLTEESEKRRRLAELFGER